MKPLFSYIHLEDRAGKRKQFAFEQGLRIQPGDCSTLFEGILPAH